MKKNKHVSTFETQAKNTHTHTNIRLFKVEEEYENDPKKICSTLTDQFKSVSSIREREREKKRY